MLKILLNNTQKIRIHGHHEYAFQMACNYGHIDIIKYLLNISEKYSSKKIDIHIQNDYIFNSACYHGNIDIIKYLLDMSEKYSGTKINIRGHTFFNAGANNQIEVLKYLINITEKYSGKKIDIHYDSDFVFITAYDRNHFKIIKYLLSKELIKYSGKAYNILIDDEFGERITDKHNKIMLLLKSVGSYNTIDMHIGIIIL
jgi:ankyrin repeat protein